MLTNYLSNWIECTRYSYHYARKKVITSTERKISRKKGNLQKWILFSLRTASFFYLSVKYQIKEYEKWAGFCRIKMELHTSIKKWKTSNVLFTRSLHHHILWITFRLLSMHLSLHFCVIIFFIRMQSVVFSLFLYTSFDKSLYTIDDYWKHASFKFFLYIVIFCLFSMLWDPFYFWKEFYFRCLILFVLFDNLNRTKGIKHQKYVIYLF